MAAVLRGRSLLHREPAQLAGQEANGEGGGGGGEEEEEEEERDIERESVLTWFCGIIVLCGGGCGGCGDG